MSTVIGNGIQLECFLVTVTYQGAVVERGHMWAVDAMELITWARTMQYGIDLAICDGCFLCSPPSLQTFAAEGL